MILSPPVHVIEAELAARIGAEPGERTPARTGLRNGHRRRLVSTRPRHRGSDPKLRTGSVFPELLEPAGGSTTPCGDDHDGLHHRALEREGR
jgi:transposase-like protein